VSVLLGRGRTFQASVRYPAFRPGLGDERDFNRREAGTWPRSSRQQQRELLLGNGDRHLPGSRRLRELATTVLVTSGDFNGDGKPDLDVANTAPTT